MITVCCVVHLMIGIAVAGEIEYRGRVDITTPPL
mgnify:CR=1 FL=1